ncbi:hypothetical protein V1511DRAFT_467905 [Dipodascopsis uninucleata]
MICSGIKQWLYFFVLSAVFLLPLKSLLRCYAVPLEEHSLSEARHATVNFTVPAITP